MLRTLGVERRNAVEIGRWIMHPDYRAGGRPTVLLAAGAAALAVRLGNGSVARRGIVVCSAGTQDRQDLMLRRVGLVSAPDSEPVACERYGDSLRVMYCVDPETLNRRFCLLMEQMAETLRLRPLQPFA
jgi:hypothetical protein